MARDYIELEFPAIAARIPAFVCWVCHHRFRLDRISRVQMKGAAEPRLTQCAINERRLGVFNLLPLESGCRCLRRFYLRMCAFEIIDAAARRRGFGMARWKPRIWLCSAIFPRPAKGRDERRRNFCAMATRSGGLLSAPFDGGTSLKS